DPIDEARSFGGALCLFGRRDTDDLVGGHRRSAGNKKARSLSRQWKYRECRHLEAMSGMCNAFNHPSWCDCGFGGDTGSSGGRWHAHPGSVATLEPVSAGWAKDSRGTVESYVNPNAH